MGAGVLDAPQVRRALRQQAAIGDVIHGAVLRPVTGRGDGVVEEHGLLRDLANLFAKGDEGEIADVVVVE